MKLKVKKCQRLTATFNTTCSQLCFCIAYVLLTICLLESFQVDAYINGATTNVTNRFQHFSVHHRGNVSRKSGSSHRIGRFLFDAFFGIETPPLDPSDFEDDDDDDDEPAKPCKCGKTK